jgi:hypothetical protein
MQARLVFLFLCSIVFGGYYIYCSSKVKEGELGFNSRTQVMEYGIPKKLVNKVWKNFQIIKKNKNQKQVEKAKQIITPLIMKYARK